VGKIISQTLEIETASESNQALEEELFVEVWITNINLTPTGLTSVGYDDEIGLWEELEHRHRLNNAFPR